jgi:hypothetical protein
MKSVEIAQDTKNMEIGENCWDDRLYAAVVVPSQLKANLGAPHFDFINFP